MAKIRAWGAAPYNIHLEDGEGCRVAVSGRDRLRVSASHHETADDYHRVVAHLCAHHRVIICKDTIQWILQVKRGERDGQPRWEGLRYFHTRKALICVSHAICGRIAPCTLAILAALPNHFGDMT